MTVSAVPSTQRHSRAEGTSRKRPDGYTLIPWRGGRPLAWDVTVCTTVAASYVTAASQSAGAAAEQAAERKSLKYAELSAAYEFQPVAVEKQGLRFLLSLSWGVRSRNTRATRLTDVTFSSESACSFSDIIPFSSARPSRLKMKSTGYVTADDTTLLMSDDLLRRNQSQRSSFAVIG